MHPRAHTFKKSPIALCLAGMLAVAASPASAVSWEDGDWSVSFDSTFSVGTSIRVEKRDINLIGKSNLGYFNWKGFNAASNVTYPSAQVWDISRGTGGYSTNGDLGNQNFDTGKAFSTLFKGVHELDVRYKDMGIFMRGMYFYDFELKNGSRSYVNPLHRDNNANYPANDPCASKKASEELCSDIRLLDFFFYSDFYLGDMPVSLRIGDQVVSWGESTFIQHGINTINPVDVTRARSPGAELKEVFIPVGMVYASIGLTDNLSVAGYYQYEYERSRLPQAGSYFAANDFAGEGGQANNVQLGFAGRPDMDLNWLLNSLNNLGTAVRSGAMDPALAARALIIYPVSVTIRGYSDAAHIDADDDGQYGLKLSYFSQELNETEFSFYHINYHSSRPVISGFTANFSPAALGADIKMLASTEITRDNITELQSFSKAQFNYPEDIKLWGMSFNTNVGETALAGEVAFRQDEPLQIDDVELLYTATAQQLANAGLRPDLDGLSQMKNIGRDVGPGQTAKGYVTSDTLQIQFTATHVFGPTLGMDNLIVLGEVGYVDIKDFPDPSVLRLNAPGTARTPSLEPTADGNPRTGLHTGLSDGPETNPFGTSDAWGYRLLANASYNDVFAGVNLNVRATFAHDVKGTTPDPLFLFIEDRKSASLAFNFDYLSKWSASFSYNAFWGGLGTTNALADRDFVSFNIKYSI